MKYKSGLHRGPRPAVKDTSNEVVPILEARKSWGAVAGRRQLPVIETYLKQLLTSPKESFKTYNASQRLSYHTSFCFERCCVLRWPCGRPGRPPTRCGPLPSCSSAGASRRSPCCTADATPCSFDSKTTPHSPRASPSRFGSAASAPADNFAVDSPVAAPGRSESPRLGSN